MKYRQFTLKLRVQRGPGRPDLVSERANRETDRGRVFLDLGPDGLPTTTVEFDEFCKIDVPSLIRSGAIAELPDDAMAWREGETGESMEPEEEADSGEGIE